MEPLGLVDAVVLLGVVVVLPLALGGRWWWWASAASSVAVALLLNTGALAAVLVLPWVAAASAALAVAVRRAGPLAFWRLDDAIRVLASVYALVAAGAMFTSRLGASMLGISEPIVALTAVHYTYAGSAALVLAGAARARSADVASAGASSGDTTTKCRRTRAGTGAVVLTAVAPPVVAVGFLLGHPLPQVGGAVLMTLGVWLTASLQLASVMRGDIRGPSRVLFTVSGLAVWAPMVLAVAWATGQHVDVPVLSIPDMARTHGLVNALGFTLCGLAGHRLAQRSPRDAGPADGAPLERRSIVPS